MNLRSRLLLGCLTAASIVTAAGCASEREWPPFASYRDAAPVIAPTPDAVDVTSLIGQGPLDLREALAAALLRNPRLAVADLMPRIAEARALQAGLRPNPELDFDVEGFAGGGELGGFDNAETTLSLGQVIELGGKRQRRIEAAEAGQAVAAAEYDLVRLDVLIETTLRYVRVVELQERIMVAEQAKQIADEADQTARLRVEAGDVAPIDATRSGLAAASADIDVNRLRRQLDAARRELAAAWDGGEPMFGTLTGRLGGVEEVPSLAELNRLVVYHPQLRLAEAEARRLGAVASLERSRATPDVRASLGAQYKAEVDEPGLVAGISIPLPLFDQNQGNILAARLEAVQATQSVVAEKLELSTRLVRLHGDLEVAYHEVRAIEQNLLPAAEQAFDATRRAYEQGKAVYLDVLESQQTLAEIRGRLVEATADYHRAKAQVEGLVAAPLRDLPPVDHDQPSTRPSTQGTTP